jgi:protein phosphatase
MSLPVLLTVDGLTDIGNRRQNNEDAWWAGQLGGSHAFMKRGEAPMRFDLASGPLLMLVSDGVGGANAGEVASQMAAKGVSDELCRSRLALANAESAKGAIDRAIRLANDAIVSKSREPGFDGMGATLSLLCFSSDMKARWGQAGDSRIYVYRHGHLHQISRDHSPVGRLRHEGKISEAEARVHPLRNQIDQSLGDPIKLFEPETGEEALGPGDLFLVCSDGVNDGLWDREIAETLAGVRSGAEVRLVLESLVGKAKAASGRDNITAVLGLVEQDKRSFWSRLRH